MDRSKKTHLGTNVFGGLTSALRRTVTTRFDSGVWLVTAIRLLTAAGFSICIPFLSLYLYQERGVPMTLVGTIILIGGLCSAVSHMIGGALSDRFGRRRLLWVAALASAFLYFGLSALIAAAAPIWAIAVVYIGGRMVLATTLPAASAVIADLTPRERLTEAYGLMRVGGNVGWAAGPAVGGYLATFLSYAWLFGLAGITSVLVLILVLAALRESFHGGSDQVNARSMLSVAGNRTFLWFTLLCLLVFLGMAHLGSTLSVFTVDRLGFSTAQYGLLLTANGIIVVLLQYPVARVIDVVGKGRSLITGSLLYALGYLSLGWVGSFGWAFPAIAVITLGEIVFAPTTLSVVGDLSPDDRRGRYMGFFGLSQTLGLSLAPFIGGVLLDVFPSDPALLWGIVASTSVAAAIGFQRWNAARRHDE